MVVCLVMGGVVQGQYVGELVRAARRWQRVSARLGSAQLGAALQWQPAVVVVMMAMVVVWGCSRAGRALLVARSLSSRTAMAMARATTMATAMAMAGGCEVRSSRDQGQGRGQGRGGWRRETSSRCHGCAATAQVEERERRTDTRRGWGTREAGWQQAKTGWLANNDSAGQRGPLTGSC